LATVLSVARSFFVGRPRLDPSHGVLFGGVGPREGEGQSCESVAKKTAGPTIITLESGLDE